MLKKSIIGIMFISMSVITGHTYALSAKEYEIKAAFLYNLGSFISWPTKAFKDVASFGICILGEDPFNQQLQSLTQDQQVSGRAISVRQITAIQEAEECQILFISASEQSEFVSVFDWLHDKPILTVSDVDDFIVQGGMLQFFKRDNKIRLALDPEAISEVGLKPSAHLMKIAELVRSSAKQ